MLSKPSLSIPSVFNPALSTEVSIIAEDNDRMHHNSTNAVSSTYEMFEARELMIGIVFQEIVGVEMLLFVDDPRHALKRVRARIRSSSSLDLTCPSHSS